MENIGSSHQNLMEDTLCVFPAIVETDEHLDGVVRAAY